MTIIDRKRFGVILRVFAKTPEQVEKNVMQTRDAAIALSNITVNGRRLFSEILVLVSNDRKRIDHDCGETAATLRSVFSNSMQIEVHEVANGDVFCGTLNYGAATLLRKRCDYSCILSHGALAYCTDDVIADVLVAFENGARAVGIAIEELSESIFEGRLANTFAFWDLVSLMSVGGFDLRAAQPLVDDRTFPYQRGWSSEKGEVFYPRAGVEEIIPLIRLTTTFGPCIAPIPVFGREWKAPDRVTDPHGWERHIKKMGTKFERQFALAASIGSDLSVLKGGVMPAYRRF